MSTEREETQAAVALKRQRKLALRGSRQQARERRLAPYKAEAKQRAMEQQKKDEEHARARPLAVKRPTHESRLVPCHGCSMPLLVALSPGSVVMPAQRLCQHCTARAERERRATCPVCAFWLAETRRIQPCPLCDTLPESSLDLAIFALEEETICANVNA